MNCQFSVRSVLVTGDMVRDYYVYEGQGRRTGSTLRLGTLESIVNGGAALLRDILVDVDRLAKMAHEDCVAKHDYDLLPSPKPPEKDWKHLVFQHDLQLSVEFGLNEAVAETVVSNGYCVFKPKVRNPKAEKEGRVWRMREALGFDSREPLLPKGAASEVVLKNEKTFEVPVIDDAGVSFRRWPSFEVWPKVLYEPIPPAPDWLVLKLSAPLACGDLWHTLVTGEAQGMTRPAQRQTVNWLARTVAIISINDLRTEPVHIAKGLSWERAAADLARELHTSEALENLRKIRFVIVSLGTDGALLADFSTPAQPVFRLIFDPRNLEGDFDASLPGSMFGFQSCLTAAVITHLPPPLAASKDALSAFEKGIKSGLCAMHRLLIDGHGAVDSSAAATAPAFPKLPVAEEILRRKLRWSFASANVPANAAAISDWTFIAGSAASAPKRPLFGTARRVALHGPSALNQAPFQQFGNLLSIERTEIENLRGLHHLMTKYRDNLSATKPLSIAVFGPPGAGKSFGVKEIARGVYGPKVPILEFNLSQFETAAELIGLLHQVRDKVLEGSLPVVFWDEFDSKDLMWLQYLLAPMQDGKFQSGQLVHGIGRCVFVFAGGTVTRFERFGVPPDELKVPGKEREREQWEQKCRAAKGPDFKSRLSGYLDVIGPNPRDASDITYPIRRALLLRVKLEVYGDAALTIDSGLLTSFLEISEYRHGARSLEKVAEQIRQASRIGESRRSDVPPRGQLEMHVDADKFLSLMERK